ncbi:hypothetical protein [Aliarcobacter skirrowii]|uniref:hypothetical protein n=1 Tax=Aliarcobacter skirrowii TaxID=28200 RepID=UPI00082F53DD|nr:hypothetical protein [Aliarcobacter skirrowii]
MIYSNIRKFRKSKKHTFIVEIDFYGYRFWSDWTTTGSEAIYLIISDVNKEAVINRIVSHEKTKDATSLIVDFAIGDFSQGTIKNISFLPITKENIEKAKLHQKNSKYRYKKTYVVGYIKYFTSKLIKIQNFKNEHFLILLFNFTLK